MSIQLREGRRGRIRRWGTRVGLAIRREIDSLKAAYKSWRQWRAAGKNRHTPLREFIYLDEVSVYSLIASRLGPIAAEFSDTQTESLQDQVGVSAGVGAGGVSARTDTRQISTKSQQSQVVRRSIIQTTFRQFREFEKSRFAISLPQDTDETPKSEMPDIASWDDLLKHEEVLKNHRLLFDEEKLDRGALVEVRVVLETHATFQVSTVFQALAEMIAEKPDFFGTETDVLEDGKFVKRIVDRLLVGLIPLRGVVIDYAVVVLSGRRFIVHRDLCEKLATVELDGGNRVHPVPLHVVGVAEEALFWKDIKRVLFSRAEFLVMCRMSSSGLKEVDSWSPMKLGQVIGSVAPDIERQINALSLEGIFNAAESENETQDDGLAARRALLEYAASLLDDKGCSLGATEFSELDAMISERSSEFRTADQQFSAFKAIEEYMASRFGVIEIDADEEYGRRQTALASVGLSYLHSEPSTEVTANDEADSEEHPLILDTEFIAIYW